MAIIDKPSDFFDSKLYTGNAGTQNITGLDFQPDWVSIKDRGATNSFMTFDSVRGATKLLNWNTNALESTQAATLTSFNSDGFSIGNNTALNTNGNNLVAWNWKKTADSGFDIITATGTGSAKTIAHNLSAVPSIIISKEKSGSVNDWVMYHVSLGNNKKMILNETNAVGTDSCWNNTTPTASVFSVSGASVVNRNNSTYVYYLLAPKQGYSKFGSYTGNGNANGPFTYLGFKPAMVIIKRTDVAKNWYINDNLRDGYNNDNPYLSPNLSAAETGGTEIDILSNGFKIRASGTGHNASGGNYIYMAFAANPFVTSTDNGSIPATAR